MDVPVRSKLIISFSTVVLLAGALTVVSGSVLINRMVVDEAQRRVELGLTTARAMLDLRVAEVWDTVALLADWEARGRRGVGERLPDAFLEQTRRRLEYDFIHLVDARGVVTATARGSARGMSAADSPVVAAAFRKGRPHAGLGTMSQEALEAEAPELAARVRVEAGDQKPSAPGEVLVMEAAAPILGREGQVLGAVRAGVVLNRNHALVDLTRDSIFTAAAEDPTATGAVSLFLGDVRVATNVPAPGGERALGTRASAQVHREVLEQGKRWTGSAPVLGVWYVTAYEPLLDAGGRPVGMLGVGINRARYDTMGRQVTGVFLLIAFLALVLAVVAGSWQASRFARPIRRLTDGAAAVAGGDLAVRLPEPPSAEHDEIKRLTVAFNGMLAALRERDEQLRRSHEEVERQARELERWSRNYLDTLAFITHELKNHVAAMKINLLAVTDGYMGTLSEDQSEALGDVLAAADRAEEMILNYLNLSRIEKGELDVRMRPVTVAELVEAVLRTTRPWFDSKQMRVETDIPEDLVVAADPSLLQTVYENLLTNAAKYGREGGLVRAAGKLSDGWIELEVWNEGPGVSPEQLGELFQKFTRFHSPGEFERGTGLGLFITREIIRKHGGDIHAESSPGEWIRFTFSLPRPDMVREEQIG